VNRLPTMRLLTRRSGLLASSPKLLLMDLPPGGSTMLPMAEMATEGAVALPPSEPAVVWPLIVPAGCVGWVTV
jgi:hypothetical protein